MGKITVDNLIQYFIKNVQRAERSKFGGRTGEDPNFPMVLIFLGEQAVLNAYKELTNNLYDLWPAYKDDILCLGATKDKNGGLSYFNLTMTEDESNDDCVATPIAPEKIGDNVSLLFGAKKHFSDKSRLLVFYVLEASEFCCAEDFSNWIDAIKDVKNTFADDSISTIDTLILMLNENIGKMQSASARIKNRLSELYYSDTVRKKVNFSTLLLSNRRSDNAILEDFISCYRIAADTVALMNRSNSQVNKALFGNGECISTAAYAREEKPISAIAQIVVKKLIEKLSESILANTNDLLSDEHILNERLGISNSGTLKLLDKYAEEKLFRMLPTEDELQFFPRKECGDADISSFSYKEFNSFTMGAWETFIGTLADCAMESSKKDYNVKDTLCTDYAKYLSDECSINDLIYLKNRTDVVRKQLSGTVPPSHDMHVLSAAKAELKYMISSQPEFVDMFVKVIEELGENAEHFLQEWDNLVESGRRIHSSKDNDMTGFYTHKMRDFFDRHKEEISAFEKIKDIDTMGNFLHSILDSIIDDANNRMLLAPFEEELEQRLEAKVGPDSTNAKDYIRRKLTGDNVPIYYRVQFSLGEPSASCVLIKRGSSLLSSLKEHLSDKVYCCYDTGDGNYAETVSYYTVSADNLLSKES